jgi:hypothetical protein
MNASRTLALAAGLLMAVPQRAGGGTVFWVGYCDAAHPGRQIPIPLDREGDNGPGKACHAGCGTIPDRRARR